MKLSGFEVCNTLMGMEIVVHDFPPEQRVKLRDIKFSDGTSILSADFIARENAWYAEQFGYRDVAYRMNGKILMSRKMYNDIRNSLNNRIEDMCRHAIIGKLK